jgi:hypothetical protein
MKATVWSTIGLLQALDRAMEPWNYPLELTSESVMSTLLWTIGIIGTLAVLYLIVRVSLRRLFPEPTP